MEEKKEIKEGTTKFELTKVPIEYTLAIRDDKGKILSQEEAIVLLLNEVIALRKAITG